MSTYDITIIGSGPGGYVAAIRCAQLGMKTALIEKYDTLGGTCLNVGCIPSKALLDSSEHFHNATHNFAEHGIDVKGVKANIEQMINRKNAVVQQTTQGIKFLMDKNDIDVHHGLGSFIDKNTVNVLAADKSETTITTKNVLIATGSKPNFFPGMEPDKKRIITSTEALNMQEIPKTMVVIGGGVIGLELGSVFSRLGTKVEVVEFAKKII
ncbi:FAD-dependent oxidoreductase, partial [Crocinitomicaceae bacterium]|nr:FAD-dependent oxidoreductase [Crocinitomicaceae bacterium]